MEKLLTPAELREKLSISLPTYQRMLAEGMPSHRTGKSEKAHHRFNYDKVLAWMERPSKANTFPESGDGDGS